MIMARGRKTGGRQVGSLNKLTVQFKTAVANVYLNLGGDEAFTQWARENPSEFYRIAARLIPAEAATTDGNRVTVVINRGYDLEEEVTPSLPYSHVNRSKTDNSC
jgi:hypothetical protein